MTGSNKALQDNGITFQMSENKNFGNSLRAGKHNKTKLGIS